MTTRRALLIGATALNLRGVERDLELMQEALARHGFAPAHTQVLVPATRASIVQGMARLREAVEPGDAVLIYYSGHGAALSNTGLETSRASLGEAAYHRFLVPSDFEDSTEDDFRGYTNAELSLDLAALTRVTPNVAAIMDCCHAGRIFRAGGKDDERLVWGDGSNGPPTRHLEVTGRWARAAEAHYARLREARGIGLRRRAAEANPHVVQLLASASSGPAFETSKPRRGDPSWRAAGVMTQALHGVLMTVDPSRTTWQQLGRELRMTPQRGVSQRITIEGPYRRFLFSLAEREELGEIDLDLSHERPLLAGGWVADLATGDRFELRTLGDYGQARAVGEASAGAVTSSLAEIVTSASLAAQLAPGSSARPIGYAKARAAIEIHGLASTSPEFARLDARLSASGYLQPVVAGGSSPLPVVGSIVFDAGKIQLRWGTLALGVPRYFDAGREPSEQLQALAEHLNDAAHRVARASRLRSIAEAPPTHPDEQLDDSWELALYLVDAGRRGRALAPRDQARFGDTLGLELRANSRLFLTALLIQPDATISRLTRAQGGGVEVQPGPGGYVLGQRSADANGALRGVSIRRPSASVISPKAGPLTATIVIALSDGPLDLRSWEQRGVTRFNPHDPLGPESRFRNIKAPPPPLRPARVQLSTYHLQLVPQ